MPSHVLFAELERAIVEGRDEDVAIADMLVNIRQYVRRRRALFDKIAAMLEAGKAIKQIAHEVGVSGTAVIRYAERIGARQPKFRRPTQEGKAA